MVSFTRLLHGPLLAALAAYVSGVAVLPPRDTEKCTLTYGAVQYKGAPFMNIASISSSKGEIIGFSSQDGEYPQLPINSNASITSKLPHTVEFKVVEVASGFFNTIVWYDGTPYGPAWTTRVAQFNASTNNFFFVATINFDCAYHA